MLEYIIIFLLGFAFGIFICAISNKKVDTYGKLYVDSITKELYLEINDYDEIESSNYISLDVVRTSSR